MSLNEKKRKWIESFSTAGELTSQLNVLLKNGKITLYDLKEIYKHYVRNKPSSTNKTQNTPQ